MQLSTTIRSPGALALGVFLAAVTARTIFDDVWHGAEVTVAHMQSLAAIVAAIASGHMLLPALKRAQIAAALGLALIFVSATGYVVVSAGARNAEAMQAKDAAITTTNEQRTAAQAKVDVAETELANARRAAKVASDAAAKECASGKGKRCDGRNATRDAAAAIVEKAEGYAILMQAKLDVLKPKTEAHGGYAHAARVFAAIPGITARPDDIEGRLVLLLPFATVLISEIGTLTFLGMALGSGGTRQPAPAFEQASEPPFEDRKAAANDLAALRASFSGGVREPAIDAPTVAEVIGTFSGNRPDPNPPTPPRGPKKRKPLPANVVDFRAHPVVTALKNNGGSVASNRELAKLMAVTDGEASKRWQEIEDQLDVRRVGKELRISLKAVG